MPKRENLNRLVAKIVGEQRVRELYWQEGILSFSTVGDKKDGDTLSGNTNWWCPPYWCHNHAGFNYHC